jgi:hypothetical protein
VAGVAVAVGGAGDAGVAGVPVLAGGGKPWAAAAAPKPAPPVLAPAGVTGGAARGGVLLEGGRAWVTRRL